MKKKILIGVGVFFGIIIAVIAAAVIYFWPFISSVDWSIVSVSNVKALYTAFTSDEETINTKLKEIDDKRAEEIKGYLEMEIRDFTEEELAKIESGEITKTQLIAQIISENVQQSNVDAEVTGDEADITDENNNSSNNETSVSNDKSTTSNTTNNTTNGNNSSDTKENNTTDNSKTNTTTKNNTTTQNNNNTTSSNNTNNSTKPNANNTTNSGNKNQSGTSSNTSTTTNKSQTADEIVAKHISVLYSYYSEFEGRVNSLASSARNWMHAYKKSNNVTWKEAKVATMQHFTSQASQIESECYAKVDAQIAQLRAELTAAGASTDVVNTVADSAYSEMEVKKSQIIQQGMAKMNKE